MRLFILGLITTFFMSCDAPITVQEDLDNLGIELPLYITHITHIRNKLDGSMHVSSLEFVSANGVVGCIDEIQEGDIDCIIVPINLESYSIGDSISNFPLREYKTVKKTKPPRVKSNLEKIVGTSMYYILHGFLIVILLLSYIALQNYSKTTDGNKTP